MKYRLLTFLAATLAFHVTARAQTQVPSLINYQGYVANNAGMPIGNGAPENRTVTFRFWNSPSDTAPASRLWSESQAVTILDGDFSVLIGSGAAVAGEVNSAATLAEVFSAPEIFLGITVDDGSPTVDAEISPRQQLVSTAFAFRASVAESVDNGAISNAMISPNAVDTAQLINVSVTNAKLGASSVDSAKIQDNTITSSDILDETITAADIGAGQVDSSEIAASSINSAKIQDGTVDSDDIKDDAITAAKIAANAVGTSEIENGSITNADIQDRSILGIDIGLGQVGVNEIATDAVRSAEIFAGAVNTSELANGSVTSAKMGTGTMQSLESLRIIRGVVATDGSITSGVGFTVTKTGTGSYILDFNPDFSDTPTISIPNIANGLTSAAFLVNTGFVSPDTSTKGRVQVLTYVSSNLFDLGFTFTAIGPR